MLCECSPVGSCIFYSACWTRSRRKPGALQATNSPVAAARKTAYFYLRRRGYVMVARNFRTARHHGEIDLIGWDNDVLCFIEVKTRTSHDVKLAVAAVNRKKRHDIRVVIRDYLRPLAESLQWRFDVVTVYYEGRALQPAFELFQNAALSS